MVISFGKAPTMLRAAHGLQRLERIAQGFRERDHLGPALLDSFVRTATPMNSKAPPR